MLEAFTAEVNRFVFLREYSFAKNVFRAPGGQELELADHLIAHPDALFVFQLKERTQEASPDKDAVAKWFAQKVTKVGCGQIADSIRFLSEQPKLLVPNQRGYEHDLAADPRPVIPIILYSYPSENPLPSTVESKRYHNSRRAGFVHILSFRNYCHLCQALALPSELIAYFSFRRTVFLQNPENQWSESQMAAQFIANTNEPLPQEEARLLLSKATDDTSSFDVGSLLREFGDKISHQEDGGGELDYYRILGEFSRLNRAEMRGFKQIFDWALEHAGAKQLQLPVRMQSTNTKTSFVIFPVPDGAFQMRLNALRNFATLAKYDFRAERQIGASVARDGEAIQIDWLFMEFPWQADSNVERSLERSYPFHARPKPKVTYRYPD